MKIQDWISIFAREIENENENKIENDKYLSDVMRSS